MALFNRKFGSVYGEQMIARRKLEYIGTPEEVREVKKPLTTN